MFLRPYTNIWQGSEHFKAFSIISNKRKNICRLKMNFLLLLLDWSLMKCICATYRDVIVDYVILLHFGPNFLSFIWYFDYEGICWSSFLIFLKKRVILSNFFSSFYLFISFTLFVSLNFTCVVKPNSFYLVDCLVQAKMKCPWNSLREIYL